MTAFANHFAFEFKTGLRNPTLLLLNYLLPLGFYAFVGLVMTKINPTFTPTMLPAMVVFAVLSSTILGLPGPLVESREAGVFRSFKINGVPALSILVIPVLTTVFHALIAAVIITLTATPLFGAPVPTNWPGFILVILLAAFAYSGLGALIGVVSGSSRGTVLWSQLIYLPSILLGGMMVPLSMLPASIRPAAALLPTAHVMQAFVGLAYQQETVFHPLASVVILLVGGLLAYGLAIYLFNWDSKNSTRRGHPLLALLVLVPYVVGMFL